MHTRRLAYSSLLALFCLALLLTGCQKKSGADESEASYDQAARFTRQKKYSAAIEAYNKALAQDTLHGFSRRSLDGFREKERLESLVGEYYQALGSCRVLEKHAVQLADSVHTAVVTQKATMLSELGEFSAAAESLARLRHPKPEEQLSWQLSGSRQVTVVVQQRSTRLFRFPVETAQ